MEKRTDQKVKTTIEQWQQAAATRREQAARRAGVGVGVSPPTSAPNLNVVAVSSQRRSKRSSKRKSSLSRRSTLESKEQAMAANEDVGVAAKRDQRRSMNATKISGATRDSDLYYHKPVKVGFKY